MSQILKGVSIIVIAIYLLWMAYNNANKSAKGFWAILILGFILRLFVSSDQFLHDWDERYHALVAKNLMDNMLMPLLHKTTIFNYDFKDWTNNYIWLHKPPFSLWLMSTSMRFWGVSELALRLPSVIFSTLSIALTYKIAIHLYPENKNIGLLAAFFQSVNGFVIEICGGRIPTDHVDTLLLFWIELGAWLTVRQALSKWSTNKIIWIVIITNFAILTKWLVALFIPFLFFCLKCLNEKRISYIFIGRFILTCLLSIILPLLWASYLYSNFPMEFSWEQSLNAIHLHEVIEGHSGEWWYYLDRARINLNEGIYIIFLYFFYTVFYSRRKPDMFLLIWVLVPYVLFSSFATKMNGYVMISFPPIFIIMSKFVIFCWEKTKTNWQVLAILVILLSLRYCIERVKPFYVHPDSISQMKIINMIKSTMPNKSSSVVFNNSYYIETMFYTNIVSRRGVPTHSEIDIAKRHFEKISIVNEDNNLPAWILLDTSVQVINVNQ